VRVRTSLAEGNLLQVDVIDKGIGIPAKDQGRIFDRFFRGDDPLVMQTAGTGLGLALAKILIEMQDGKIWFTSSGIAGEGSTFSFTLPAFQPRELTQGSAAEQTQP
jgi:signal transduction histidine kinase